MIAIASAYPQNGWGSQSQNNNDQWGGWGQSAQPGQSPTGQQNQPQVQDPSESRDAKDETLNEIDATVGTAIVAINGSVYYRIQYASDEAKADNKDQSSQKPASTPSQS